MGGRSKESTVGYRYYFGIHMGIGRGPVDALHEIRVADKQAWFGEATANTTINIDAPALFGGEEKEGGIQGPLELMFGEADQEASTGLKAMLGNILPGFRGMFTAFFNGLICMNNPYPKPWKFRFGRVLKGWDGAVWYPEKARIGLGSGSYDPVVLPESMLVSVWAWRRDSTVYDEYDISKTALPTWESYYGELGESALLSMNIYTNPTAPGDSGVLPTKTIPFDETRDYFIHIGNGFWSNDVSDAKFEFLDEAGNVVAAIVTEDAGAADFQHFLKYGPNLTSLTTVSQATFTSGTISLSDGLLTFTKGGSGSTYNSNFSLACDALSIRSIRMSDVRVRSTYTGASANPAAFVVLKKQPKTSPGYTFAAYSMNPAHIIYECLTNRVWGRGLASAKLDLDSFATAANALFDEQFGLCLKWTRKDSIESFVQGVLDHIGAVLFVSRTTKLLTLKLIRADYTLASLPTFDTESGILEISDAAVSSIGAAVNAVFVTYHDWVNDEDKTVGEKNVAAIAAAGGVVNSVTKSYPGIPTASLALRVAMRDLRAVSTNLRKFTVVMDRRGEDIEPGSVFALEDPKRGIPKMAVRVGRVEDGTLVDGRITLTVIQDVFSLPETPMTAEVPSTWVPPNTTPCIDQQLVMEAPYFVLAGRMSKADLDYMTPDSGYIAAINSRGQPLNQGFRLAVRTGAPTVDDNPPDSSYVCET
jgi:hypothetical protein